ncbi:MAG: ABC transporter permease [Deltaproteobacteria bacterium]|nr:ABC transporter permease [Deltaproteobacteria bacterium]
MNQKMSRRQPPLLILPSLAWFIVFLIIPIGIVILYSVRHKGAYGQVDWSLNLDNYKRAFEPIYLMIVARSLWLAAYTTAICLALSYPLAYFMARSSEGAKKALLALVIIPFWTNFVIRVYSLKLVLGEAGTINSVLLKLHLISAPLQMVDNSFGVSIGMVYNYLPFMVLPMYVALDKFDFTLMDAAYDLGATKTQTIIRVLLPLSLPGIVTGSLFVFIPAFGEFVIPDLLGGSQSMYVGTLITETFLKSRDWPFGSALSSFLVLFAMAAFMFVLSRQAADDENLRRAENTAPAPLPDTKVALHV